MNESDTRGEDDLGRGETEVVYFRLHLKVSMVGDERISRSIEFKMTGTAERKEREPKLVLGGIGRRKVSSEERRERTG